jgi:hypothetical protein
MSEQSDYEAIPLGFEMGPLELLLDRETVMRYSTTVQWKATEIMEIYQYAPPGMTILHHAKMKFQARPGLKAAIWAKTEHEFIKPMKIGAKVFIRGKVVEKYVKRGRNYLVAEYETRDENGELLMKSRETGVHLN